MVGYSCNGAAIKLSEMTSGLYFWCSFSEFKRNFAQSYVVYVHEI
jgi:hypothetical protein